MNLDRAFELMGVNFIQPQLISECLGVEFSEKDLDFLKNIPLEDKDILADDFYDKLDKNRLVLKKVKETHILFPLPTINVFKLIHYFGFTFNEFRKIFFVNNSVPIDGYLMPDWADWYINRFNNPDHPIYRVSKISWLLMRKKPIPDSLGKNLKNSSWYLAEKYSVPSLLEVLMGMIVYYFAVKNSKKNDFELDIPNFESREWAARILSGRMTWTSDLFLNFKNDAVENLVVGLNTPESGIYIRKLNSLFGSGTIGLLPIRRLSNN